MKRKLTVVAVIRPVPQPRQRHSGKRSYLPEKHPIHNVKAAVRAAGCRLMKGRPPIAAGAPLSVSYTFIIPRPPSYKKSAVREPHIMENADSDNLQKAVQDALTKIVWSRDGAIWKWSGEKWIGATGELGRIEVEIIW